jgi:hypothetical protein
VRVKQTRLLARTFFVGLFESDLMPPGLPQVQLIIWSVVLLATPTLTLPGVYSQKYTRLWAEPGTGMLSMAINTDRLVLITFAMIALGFVALVIWEGVFPDRRDARILGVLPISTVTFVSARVLAVGALFALFFATLGAIPSLLFAYLTAAYGQAGGFVRGTLAQFVAVLAAGLFTFSGVVGLQCLLINVAGRTAAQRIAVVLQILFSIALLQLIFFLPSFGRLMTDGNLGQDWLSAPAVRLLPPVWFFGVYEVLSGFGGRNAFALARVGGLLTGLTVGLCLLLYLISYPTMAARALETPPIDARWSRRLGWIASRIAIGRYAPRAHPVARAVKAFTLRTVVRSRQHRMLLAIYIGLGLAIVISALVPPALKNGMHAFSVPRIASLAAPLVMLFFVLVGMRVVFAIPAEPKANWALRLREPADHTIAVDGVRNAMLLSTVVPIVMLAALSAVWLWGVAVAAVHTIVCALLGWLLVEILLVGFRKIPFACTYLPGRSRIKTLWPLYLTGFTTYSFSMASLELVMLQRPRVLIAFTAIVCLAILTLTHVRWRVFDDGLGFRFVEEDPEALFTGFQLSEGLAAQTQPRPLS